MNYLWVIRPQPEQINQPQSCAFLHFDDWMRSILTGGVCRLHVGAGQFYYPLTFLLHCSGDFAGWSSMSRERGRGDVTGCQLKCRPRHLTEVQTYKVRSEIANVLL
ncbi:hypothetical protein AVEN_210545-1 [Araneus ventricosus]|uniref:Uncharacterized protein n=1 Tax=Araneus ventricosus TaxID=182803 RepID=A0A4Y2FQX1_ARAVE|nr:hypothetical protein AVEN_210545-1 [Araneus ventricosus]